MLFSLFFNDTHAVTPRPTGHGARGITHITLHYLTYIYIL